MAGRISKAKFDNQPGADSAFNELVDETVRLYRRLNLVAEEVHEKGEMSGGVRGILLTLKKDGAQTVPHLARSKSVSRQHIQVLVNQLIEEGFVKLQTNPAHKRSPLLNLTPLGERVVTQMAAREARLLSKADLGLTDAIITEAAHSLRIIREFFESDAWQRILKGRN
jgi:DNA-binding MarR family transcriptional regulator